MHTKKLLTFTGAAASLFLSEFQAKAKLVEILCPTHGKVTYNGSDDRDDPARCILCYPSGHYDYWCADTSCQSWKVSPSTYCHPNDPIIPEFFENFFYKGYSSTSNRSKDARSGTETERRNKLLALLRQEVKTLPQAQVALEALSWYTFYMLRQVYVRKTRDNNSLGYEWLHVFVDSTSSRNTYLNTNRERPLFFRAPDKLLEKISLMGGSFAEMCKSMGWIRSTGDTSTIFSQFENYLKNDLKYTFDEHTGQLTDYMQGRSTIGKRTRAYNFHFFSPYENIGDEFWQEMERLDNNPIKDPDNHLGSLGNVPLNDLASAISRLAYADPTILRYYISEKCFLEIEEGLYGKLMDALRQLEKPEAAQGGAVLDLIDAFSNDSDIEPILDDLDSILEMEADVLTRRNALQEILAGKTYSVLQQQDEMVQAIKKSLENTWKNLQSERASYLDQLKGKKIEEKIFARVIRIVAKGDAIQGISAESQEDSQGGKKEDGIPRDCLEQQQDSAFIKTIPLYQILEKHPGLASKTTNNLLHTSDFDPHLPLDRFPDERKSLRTLFENHDLTPSPLIFTNGELDENLKKPLKEFVKDNGLMQQVQELLAKTKRPDFQQEEIETPSLYDLSAQAIPVSTPLKEFIEYPGTLDNLLEKLGLTQNGNSINDEDIPHDILTKTVAQLQGSDFFEKPLNFFFIAENGDRTIPMEIQQTRRLCKKIDEKLSSVKDCQIFASALSLYAHYVLKLSWDEFPYLKGVPLVSENAAFSAFNRFLQEVRAPMYVINLCYDLGKVERFGFPSILDSFLNLLKKKDIEINEKHGKFRYLIGRFDGTKRSIYFPLCLVDSIPAANPMLLALCADMRHQITDLFPAQYIYYILAKNSLLPERLNLSLEVLKQEHETVFNNGTSIAKPSLRAQMKHIEDSWIGKFSKDMLYIGRANDEREKIYRVFLKQLEKCGCEIDGKDINKIKKKRVPLSIQGSKFSIEQF